MSKDFFISETQASKDATMTEYNELYLHCFISGVYAVDKTMKMSEETFKKTSKLNVLDVANRKSKCNWTSK
jgi:hypothetical protein